MMNKIKPLSLITAVIAVVLSLNHAAAQILFMGDAGSNSICKFTTNGVQSTFASGLDGPAGLAFDSSGNLFAADLYSGNIYKFTTNGMQTTFASELSPLGIAFDGNGNFF